MGNEPAVLTVEQAYKAMLLFLKGENELSESMELDELLSQYALKGEGKTVDPAAWRAWLNAVAQVSAGAPAGNPWADRQS